MRRGHPGNGGWRNENARHFRPRGRGTSHFRSSRGYALLEEPRFPSESPRLQRGSQSYSHQGHLDEIRPNHHERNQYRGGHQTNYRGQERSRHNRDRQNVPYHLQMRHKDNSNHGSSHTDSNFYEDINVACHINNMGNIDHRTQNITFNQRQISPWINPAFETKRHYYDDQRNFHKHRHLDIDERNKLPVVEYTGHRPPSSDHYVGKPGPATNNNNTAFTRSVDDTVDLVRKRLMNRNESQPLLEDPPIDGNSRDCEMVNINDSYQNIQQEPPVKKRIPRQRQNVKSNCDKIKNKIVHQLFKMDKDKIHKLMDNPNSSIKFEYAISSLITESQNSFNKHLRSVAEKSLCSSSSDFIQNDNNTIYEDTFMKQMQCILDPQDTVLLEDIKPLVMAELSKVLQLGDFDHRFEMTDDQNIYHMRDDSNFQDFGEVYNNEDFLQDPFSENDHSSSNYETSENIGISEETDGTFEYNQSAQYNDSKVLFERRPSKKNDYNEERRRSSESRQSRRSLDKSNEDKFNSNEKQPPFFRASTEQLSEEEDPFADLDNQYHVAVDHNFIENDDISSPPKSISYNNETPLNKNTKCISTPYNDSAYIKKEIDNQLLSIAKSPLKLFSSITSKDENELILQNSDDKVKEGVIQYNDCAKENISSAIKYDNVSQSKVLDTFNLRQEQIPKNKETDKDIDRSESSSNFKSFLPTTPRKRSIDQRPSHRKEKRKKSESSPSDTNKPTPTHDASTSVFNLYFSKDQDNRETSKDDKKIESADKGYSDKYVKRKELPKKTKEKNDTPKKRNSNSSSHSILSPKESNNLIISNQALTKSDAKTKLKTIDIFTEQPRKLGSVHQSHRNTAPTPPVTIKTERDENKPKHPVMQPRKATLRHVGTQVIKRYHMKETQTVEIKRCNSKFSQTERFKVIAKSTQTDNIAFEKPKYASEDAFERMKEIDLEIQVLLQEKFKLYNSLESKHSSNTSTMQTLGMTVLNVTSAEQIDSNSNDTEDAIVNNFTNIPVEELEQIAFETIQEETQINIEKKNLPERLLRQERKSSESPTNLKRSNRKPRTPNISLLEQIITDERPLEEIISLDDLESTPIKSKKKPQRPKSKKKIIRKIKTLKTTPDTQAYTLKECSILLKREDIRKYLKNVSTEPVEYFDEKASSPSESVGTAERLTEDVSTEEKSIQEKQTKEPSSTVEDSVVNDLQFDMLDVSEDIVIGDSCEVKSSEDKDMSERIEVPTNEEIILDNSQSSLEDVYPSDVAQLEIECKMYDYSTDENLRRDSVTVTGNADAVLAIECIENNFIAACLDGNVYHFSGDGQLINTLRGSNLAVTCLTIVQEKFGTTVYTGSLDSRIRYYDLETGLEKGPECNVLSPIQTMDRAWDTVFVGTRTGFVLQFECKNNMLIPVSTVKFSDQSILALRAMKEGPRKVLLVAARSENVTIKDAQTGLLLRTLNGPMMTVYTLLFEDGKVYCGTSSHQIHVFDYASGSHVGAHEGGKGAVCLRATGGLLFAGCYDGCVYVYKEGETRPLAQLRGPGLMLLSLAIVGSKIIAGYKDRSLYIWKIPLTILQEMIL